MAKTQLLPHHGICWEHPPPPPRSAAAPLGAPTLRGGGAGAAGQGAAAAGKGSPRSAGRARTEPGSPGRGRLARRACCNTEPQGGEGAFSPAHPRHPQWCEAVSPAYENISCHIIMKILTSGRVATSKYESARCSGLRAAKCYCSSDGHAGEAGGGIPNMTLRSSWD